MHASHNTREFRAGIVTSTHGLKGEIKIHPETACVRPLCDAGEYLIYPEDKELRKVKVRRATPHKHMVLAALDGYFRIESAKELIGAEVYIDPYVLPEVKDGNYYWHQLHGLRVVDRNAGDIGILDNVLSTPGHYIYVVQGAFGEVMIPAVDAMLERVDLDAGFMYVDLPQGLVELN